MESGKWKVPYAGLRAFLLSLSTFHLLALPVSAQDASPAAPGGGIREFTKSFREYSLGKSSVYLFVAVGVIGAGLILALVWRVVVRPRFERIREIERLFTALMDANRLNSAERDFLRSAARFHQLENPSVLFVRRSLLDEYALKGRDRAPELADRLVEKLYV